MESVDAEYAEKASDFALALLRRSAAQCEARAGSGLGGGTEPPRPGTNVLLSPASVVAALAAAYAGADGLTKRQMNETVFGGLDDHTVEKNVDALTRLLIGPAPAQADPAVRGYTLSAANRLFAERTFHLLPSFIESLRGRFRAEAVVVDFKHNAPQAVKDINAWVAEETRNKIMSLFDELDSSVCLVLANAIYFKGDWSTKFDPDKTTPKPFYPAESAAAKTLDTMYARSKKAFGFNGNDEHCSLLSLPYKGDDLSMVILLPKQRFGLAALEQNLTGDRLWSLINKAHNVDVIVELPKFRLESNIDIKACLMKMGVVHMFSSAANFSKISTAGDVFVSAVQHKAFLEVNEEGSEAAAVTGISAMKKCLTPAPEEFKADHPFLFAIVEKRNRVLLFLGHFYG